MAMGMGYCVKPDKDQVLLVVAIEPLSPLKNWGTRRGKSKKGRAITMQDAELFLFEVLGLIGSTRWEQLTGFFSFCA
jgi:hypothetical protein